jgi:hypothetical protein
MPAAITDAPVKRMKSAGANDIAMYIGVPAARNSHRPAACTESRHGKKGRTISGYFLVGCSTKASAKS